MPEFPTEPPVEIARRLEIRGNDSSSWMAVLMPLLDSQLALDGLQADLSSVLQKPTRTIHVKQNSFEHLRADLHRPSDDIVILVGISDLTANEWSSVDLMRSALERPGPVVLWMSADAFDGLSEFAPNIRSFIGPSIFVVGPDGSLMTEGERLARLLELARHYGQSDEDVIRKAESGTLSLSPHFVEWLVLLGRGDLI